MEREEDFIDAIDGSFPFDDLQECNRLITEAIQISPKAVFKVVQEICTIEEFQREDISDAELLSLLNEIKRKFEHPLKDMLLEVATKMVNGIELTSAEVLPKMEQVRKFPNLFPALWILTFSSYDTGVNEAKDNIYAEWNSLPED